MVPTVDGFFDPTTNTISYVVSDPDTRRAAVIDPVLDFDPVLDRCTTEAADKLVAAVDRAGLAVDWVLETHVHADHLTAAPYVKQKLGGRIGIGSGVVEVQRTVAALFDIEADLVAEGAQFDHLFADGDSVALGGIDGRVLATPGHTPSCVCYVFGDAAFVGDTMFMPDSGTARTDFPGGCAETLHESLARILSLPPETRVFVCHDYGADGERAFAWETTVAAQRRANIHCRDGVSRDMFVSMRTARDAQLDMPRLMVPAVKANILGGRMPPPASGGTACPKVPIDVP